MQDVLLVIVLVLPSYPLPFLKYVKAGFLEVAIDS